MSASGRPLRQQVDALQRALPVVEEAMRARARKGIGTESMAREEMARLRAALETLRDVARKEGVG